MRRKLPQHLCTVPLHYRWHPSLWGASPISPRTKRGLAIVVGLAALGIASTLVLNAFQSNLVFFFSPSQVAANEAPRERSFRVGGLVEEGSIVRDSKTLQVNFVVTDLAKTVPVVYTGLLPDLFREGKGVVAQGKMGPSRALPRRAPSRRRYRSPWPTAG